MDASKTVPVWLIARELGVSSQVVLDACASEGWAVTSHSQNLAPDRITRLQELFPKITEGGGKGTSPLEAPTWIKVVGVSGLGVTLLFFMGAVLGGITVRPENCFFIVAVFSLGTAIGSGFLTGAAAIKGQIPIPGTDKKPVVAGATGGVATLLIVFLVGYLMVCHNFKSTNSVTMEADPRHMGSTTIAYDPNGKDSFDREAIENVEWIWNGDHTIIIQFRVLFKPGKEKGWFQAIHLNRKTKSEDRVKYLVSLHEPLRSEVTKP